jgi:hypothetical protein
MLPPSQDHGLRPWATWRVRTRHDRPCCPPARTMGVSRWPRAGCRSHPGVLQSTAVLPTTDVCQIEVRWVRGGSEVRCPHRNRNTCDCAKTAALPWGEQHVSSTSKDTPREARRTSCACSSIHAAEQRPKRLRRARGVSWAGYSQGALKFTWCMCAGDGPRRVQLQGTKWGGLEASTAAVLASSLVSLTVRSAATLANTANTATRSAIHTRLGLSAGRTVARSDRGPAHSPDLL